MSKRVDLKSILLIGSGPIVIGQACEFDYSGTQACKALKKEGYRIILVNSNPASIMTDPEFADKTYIEPIIPEILRKIIQKERPDALLPTLGGQTALNAAVALYENGTLKEFGVELIGASYEAIKKAEDRDLFKKAMHKIGLSMPRSGMAYSVQDAEGIAAEIGFPLILRPAFTLGGSGSGIVYNQSELHDKVKWGLDNSPIGQVQVEQSVLGWKEFELEVMKDKADNCVIICSIENFDPMGVHTGDSITVAPAQTLTDKEYQRLRNDAFAVIREIGVDTGGSNIQFAINPKNGDVIVIEMNPRVSRSSALASKATGFPIAKIAALLAVGYTLDEIPNDITQKTPASFEPSIDYVVTKVPRFTFEKFPNADNRLGTQMKSVGETMAIGRTFKESLQKALRSLERGYSGLEPRGEELPDEEIKRKIMIPTAQRIFFVAEALRRGMAIEEIYKISAIDPWFLEQMNEIIQMRNAECGTRNRLEDSPTRFGEASEKSHIKKLKQLGFSDVQLASYWGLNEAQVRQLRLAQGVKPVYKMVDTCAAEFESQTPYYYSTYESEDEILPTTRKKIMILGGGPNRIGQGIEFDYCCVHASFALRSLGYETIMVNSNPETVSTDYDTSDRLYFEPLTFEDVMNIVDAEKPDGVIVQFGGQTPLKLAMPLKKAGVPIIGTDPEQIDVAENRYLFGALITRLGIRQPKNGLAHTVDEALGIAAEIGYPVIVRPSYVLGGRAMEIVYDEADLRHYMKYAVEVSPEHPVLVDDFLESAIEIDVDAISDGQDCVIAGIMEHIEEAGVHSGDSACFLPTVSIPEATLEDLRCQTRLLAKALKVVGLMNIQYALKDGDIYVLEVNPRASRTVPFVSKATGVAWAKMAVQVMVGKTIRELGLKEIIPSYHCVKEAVLPFAKFPGTDPVLGPEMKSTGETMGIDPDLGAALAKAELAAGESIPKTGTAFVSVTDRDKEYAVEVVKQLVDLGWKVIATAGTSEFLKTRQIPVETVLKVHEGRPNITDHINNGQVQLIINTPVGKGSKIDDTYIRKAALKKKVFMLTTLSAARAMVRAIEALQKSELKIMALQDHYVSLREPWMNGVRT